MSKNQVITILKNLDVFYWESGKNVSADAVNIKCPFCIEEGLSEDPSNHLGVLPEKYEIFSCWRCGKSGPFVYLLRKLTGYSEETCQEIINEASEFSNCRDIHSAIKEMNLSKDIEKKEIRITGLPKYFEPVTENMDYPLMYKYLERRKISLETVIKRKCGICRVGIYMNRMIIPVISDGEVVAFQAADMSGQSSIKYETSSSNINQFLYNYDTIQENGRMILTEGILDCWRVGESATASFGTHLTDEQKHLILNKKLKEIIFAWDNDAFWKAKQQSEFFVPFVEKVGIVRFPEEHDPDSYGRDFGVEKLFELVENYVCFN